MKTLVLFALAIVLLLPVCAAGAITYDGTGIPTDFAGMLKSTQLNATGFGDTSGVGSGSELDQVFVARGTDGLYIGVTGNLETNGNAIVILLQTGEGGTNVLAVTNGPGGLNGLNGTTLDAGFAPNYAVTFNTWGGTLYINLTDLAANSDRYLGNNSVNSGSNVLIGGQVPGVLASFNNTNIAGVKGIQGTSPEQNQIDAATAATGFEIFLPFAAIGVTDPGTLTSVKVGAILDGGSSWLSNQTLPGLGGGYDNPGNQGSSFNFNNVPGDQFATADVSTPTTNTIVVDGAGIPADFSGHLAATQDNYTQYGDKSGAEGSEMDQLFLGQDSNGLQMGITGNLETGGNFWLIFLETGPGGNNTLQIPDGVGPQSGVLQALRGSTFYTGFAPTNVLCVNTYMGTAYVDLVDLRTGTSRYLGHSPVNGGSGDLIEGDNPNGAKVAFNNTNFAGVTGDSATGASTATTGGEIYLPFTDLGLAALEVKVAAIVTSNNGSLSNQSLPSLPAGTANIGAPAVDFNMFYTGDPQFVALPISGISFTPIASVNEARALPNGSAIQLTSTRVSGAFSYANQYYTQDDGSPLGLAVQEQTNMPAEGALVTVKGFLSVANGERTLVATETTTVTLPGSIHTRPVGIGGKALGGGKSGANPGAVGGAGACNLGSLVKTWGYVRAVAYEGTYFYVDDGSNQLDSTYGFDGTANLGIRVMSTKVVNVGDLVQVVGISSVDTVINNDGLPQQIRVIKTRTDDDVMPAVLEVN